MSLFDAIIESAAQNAERLGVSYENCHTDSEGLFVCNVCGKRKQHNFRGRVSPCVCECDQQKDSEERKKLKLDERITLLTERGITDRKYLRCTFESDDSANPKITKACKAYVDKWTDIKKNGIGMMFYGDVGTGKSFYACCIGNALLQKGVAVLITTLSKLVDNYVRSSNGQCQPLNMSQYSLLIIDDLGVENATPTAYTIIDDWYRSGKPLIVTTNLDYRTMQNESDMNRRRIYDRVIEMCGGCPIRVTGNRRIQISETKKQLAREILLS